MSIPERHRADEFSLVIRWLMEGGRGRIPGFYLAAGFANEGEAHWYAREVRLSPQTITNTLTTLAIDPNVDSTLMGAGGGLARASEKAVQAHHAALIVSARRAREALEAAEQALKDAGLEGYE